MRKILWMSHFLPYPPKGGALQRSYNLLKAISREFDVTLLAFNQGLSVSQIEEGVEHLSTFCKVVPLTAINSEKSKAERVKLLLKGLIPTKTYTMSWLESNAYRDVLAGLLRENTYDLIHVDTISLAGYVEDIEHCKKVLNHHNIESLMMLRRAKNEKNLLKSLYFFQEGVKLKRVEKKLCPKFDLNITCSTLDAERLNNFVKGIECIDVPNGVDLDYFNPDKTVLPEAKSLIFAGGLTWYPNLDAMTFFLKSVWPLLVMRDPEVTMTVVGRNPPLWMRELQAEYKNLLVTGFVDDVRPYFDSAAVYVCPISDGGGTKLKVLDALAMAKPLIANPIACEGIDVVNGEHVFFAETASEYVDAIQNAFNNEELTKVVASNARKLIEEKYDFIKIGEKLCASYEQLMR